MSWHISLTGKKADVIVSAAAESDTNIKNGYQTSAQKLLVVALVEALPGNTISGSINGHNSIGGCSMSLSVSSYTAGDEAGPAPVDG